jgi:hypothetical protein
MAWLSLFDDQIPLGQTDPRFLSKTGIAELIEVLLATVGSPRWINNSARALSALPLRRFRGRDVHYAMIP